METGNLNSALISLIFSKNAISLYIKIIFIYMKNYLNAILSQIVEGFRCPIKMGFKIVLVIWSEFVLKCENYTEISTFFKLRIF